MSTITYDVRIDWDNDGGFDIGNFETGTDSWVPGGTVNPTFARSTVRAYSGVASGLITWGTGGFLPLVGRDITGLTIGQSYTATAYAYVPAGSPDVLLAVAGGSVGVNMTTKDQWSLVTLTFTATGTGHTIQLWPASSPTAGQQCWMDLVRITGPGEDVTSRTLHRAGIKLQYGRDQARSESPIRPGQGSFQLDNFTRDYSPDNASSPLFGNLFPGRTVQIRAHHNSASYTLLRGSLEDYTIDPNLASRSVSFTCIDALGELQQRTVSTAVYQGARTGTAIGAVLDAAGWTAARDLDSGATVFPFWWAEGINALDAVKKILAAEGMGSIAYVGSEGEFVFRDRLHRSIRTASNTVQATFDSIAEPAIDQRLSYDVGWRDIFNYATCDITELIVDNDATVVYSDGATRNISTGQSQTINVNSSVAFVDAITPVLDTDYLVQSGSVTVSLSRTSGQAVTITITAVSTASVVGMQLRAYKLSTNRTVKVVSQDATSIARYRLRTITVDAPFIGVNDAQAILDKLILARKDRLPIVAIGLVNANDTRIAQMLSRDLSDRVHLDIPEADIDSDFFIERIEHQISADKHVTTFGCEKAFDAVTASELFILDSATQGVLGTNKLGY